MDRIIFTRKALHDLVWSEPMGTVSKRIGVESYCLRKVCIKQKIPLPKRGHWIKVQYGKAVDKVPLIDGIEKEIIFDFTEKKLQKSIELLPLLKVPSQLSNPDKLIIEAK